MTEFTEYQKFRIQEKLKLDFQEEQLKSKNDKKRKAFHKTFRSELDILIHQFYLDGIQFYGFTIDLLYLKNVPLELRWKNVHEDVEKWISKFAKEIELIEFAYISIEIHNPKTLKRRNIKVNLKDSKSALMVRSLDTLSDLQHLHGIVGVRTILGHNDYLDIPIRKVFRSCQNYEDIVVKRLYKIKDIKSYWNYVIKENNFKFHRFSHYGEHPKYNDIYATIGDNEMVYDFPKTEAFGLDETRTSTTFNVSGVKAKEPNPKTLITYLLNLFLWHKNYKVNKNKIYQQIEGSKYSWKIIDSLEALKKNNVIIFECLKKVYPMQLSEINTMEIINSNWNNTMDEIMENNQYLSSLEFKKDAIEFKDGIYFVNENKFHKFKRGKNNIDLKMKNKNSCVYFNKSYSHIKTPEIWLQSIKKTVKNDEEFCIDLARYFHSEPLEKLKQKSLLIVGGSNTGKTTLVANVIQNLFGKENIGMIGKGSNFILEQLENKDVILCDEFNYTKSNRSNLLKLMGNELDLIDKKGIQKYAFENKAPILFMFNPKLNEIMLNDDAFKNRFLHYEFKHEITEYLKDIDELLKKELPSIIIYCNKLYFKRKKLIESKKFVEKKEDYDWIVV